MIVAPNTFSEVIQTIKSGDKVIFNGGTYTLSDTLSVPVYTQFIAATGERPIFVKDDGYPPSVFVGERAIIENLWFGGTKYANQTGSTVQLKTGASIKGCTFWGYSQVFDDTESSILYSKNRFVNCGYGGFWHDIYVSNSAVVPLNTVITENIHLGGDGYKIHLYHNPDGATIHANFTASLSPFSNGDIAIQGSDHVVTNNILWGNVQVNYFDQVGGSFNKNIIGPNRINFNDIITARTASTGNVFCNGQATWGSDPQVWNEAAIASNLGKTKAEIDTAISNLITKFSQTTAEIYADATIETDFTVIRSVIDAWKTA